MGAQCLLLQFNASVSVTLNSPGGDYYLFGVMSWRGGNDQYVPVLVDGVTIDTITTTVENWQYYTSPSFSLAAGSHSIFLGGEGDSSTDRTLFLDGMALIPAGVVFTKSAILPIREGVAIGVTDIDYLLFLYLA